ncbi:LPXTG cell wall anchor domain-containing protein [Humibacter sp.]
MADTGSNVVGWALGGLGLLLAGIALALIRRRRTA